jgi:hypothetical protein
MSLIIGVTLTGCERDMTLTMDRANITYVAPAGFRQITPSAGVPPPLLEGTIYKAGGPAFNANGGSIRFTIKDGRAVELPENK